MPKVVNCRMRYFLLLLSISSLLICKENSLNIIDSNNNPKYKYYIGFSYARGVFGGNIIYRINNNWNFGGAYGWIKTTSNSGDFIYQSSMNGFSLLYNISNKFIRFTPQATAGIGIAKHSWKSLSWDTFGSIRSLMPLFGFGALMHLTNTITISVHPIFAYIKPYLIYPDGSTTLGEPKLLFIPSISIGFTIN